MSTNYPQGPNTYPQGPQGLPEQPNPFVQPQPPKKKHTLRNVLIGGGALMALMVGSCTAALAGGASDSIEAAPTKPSASAPAEVDKPAEPSKPERPATVDAKLEYDMGHSMGEADAAMGNEKRGMTQYSVDFEKGYNDGYEKGATDKKASEKAAADAQKKAEEEAKKAKEQAEQEAEESKPKVVKVTAAKLIKAFEDNELKADAKYKGKTLQVSGEVKKVDTELLDEDKYILDIGSGDEWEILSVSAYDIPTDQLADLDTGDKVTVVGEFSDGGDLGVTIRNAHVA